MGKLVEAQIVQKEMVDTIRTLVRLKHRAQMRRELNELEEAELQRFAKALQSGEEYALSVASLVDE